MTAPDQLIEFRRAVAEMRRLQKAYFAGDRRAEVLIASRNAERLVDRLLAELDGAQLTIPGAS